MEVEMKITNVKATVIEVDNAYRPGQGQKGVSNFIQVFTDQGIEGRVLTDRGPFGEFRARPVSQAIVELYKPMIMGQDPLDRERLWEMMVARSFGGTMMFAVGAIDLCLWDIAGQKAGMPIYKMLGGYRDKIRAYASVFSFESPRAYADYARKIVAMGYTGIKLHLRGTYKDHIAAARAVREAVGNEIDCFFDANCRYDRRTALIVGRELEKLNYYWYEEPLPNSDIEGLRELCQVLDIPISATEEFFHVQPSHYTPYLIQHATDIMRTDALLGITLAKKVTDMCDAFHVKCEPEGWGPATGQFATLHLAGCCRNTEFFEKTEPGDAYDVCVKNPIKIDSEGFVHMPTGPGLGPDFDLDEIRRRTVLTLE
jgi:L-alanine-DL-glutamate epimerase-like enolase superfamily enzyme